MDTPSQPETKSRFWLILFAFAALIRFTVACGPESGSPVAVSIDTNGAASVDSIEVSPNTAQALDVGSVITFTATAFNASGGVVQNASVAWASSDLAVATVNSSGVATARGPGQARVTASSGTVSGSAVLTVPLVNTP